MNKKQVVQKGTQAFSRCEEQAVPITGYKKNYSPIQKSDARLEQKVRRALWKDEQLRAADSAEIEMHVTDGILYLSGHLASTGIRQRLEEALHSIPELGVTLSALILDDELMHAVTASLAPVERSSGCKFYVSVSRGAVILNGEVDSLALRKRAEQCVARHPSVRGVINNLYVAGLDLGVQDHRLLQPPIGKKIYFVDGIPGIVRQVVIDPDNRRVTAMTIQGHFFDLGRTQDLAQLGAVQSAGAVLLVSMAIMGNLSASSGFLTVRTVDTSRFQVFDPSLFCAPPAYWVPPYPYCPEQVLFAVTSRPQAKPGQGLPRTTAALPRVEEQLSSEGHIAKDSPGE